MFAKYRSVTAAAVFCVLGATAAQAQTGDARPNLCPANAESFAAAATPQWNGWGADATQRRFQGAESARLTAAAAPRLALKWAFGFP